MTSDNALIPSLSLKPQVMTLPENAGIPIGGGGSAFYRLEIHYNNHNLEAGLYCCVCFLNVELKWLISLVIYFIKCFKFFKQNWWNIDPSLVPAYLIFLVFRLLRGKKKYLNMLHEDLEIWDLYF